METSANQRGPMQMDIWRLHQLLLAGDPTASARLADACLVPLRRALRRQWPTLPVQWITDSATDAFCEYLRSPLVFDRQKGSLLGLLKTIAGRRLVDRIRRSARRREIPAGGTVELEGLEAKHYQEEPACIPMCPDLSEEVQRLVCEILPEEADRDLLQMLCEGRCSTDQYARRQNILDLPRAEQEIRMKRHRDRVLARLRRRREEFRRILDET